MAGFPARGRGDLVFFKSEHKRGIGNDYHFFMEGKGVIAFFESRNSCLGTCERQSWVRIC